MIHRIESAFLRTQDSLSKREQRQGRRPAKRPGAVQDASNEPVVEVADGPTKLEEEHVSVALDLVA